MSGLRTRTIAILMGASALAVPSLAHADAARERALEARLEKLEAQMAVMQGELAAARGAQAEAVAAANAAAASASQLASAASAQAQAATSKVAAIPASTVRLLHIRLDSPIASVTESDALRALGNDIDDPLRHNDNLFHRLPFQDARDRFQGQCGCLYLLV